jgi:hypothetical protein
MSKVLSLTPTTFPPTRRRLFSASEWRRLAALYAFGRGLLNRPFGGRLQKLMNHSWQMYPFTTSQSTPLGTRSGGVNVSKTTQAAAAINPSSANSPGNALWALI